MNIDTLTWLEPVPVIFAHGIGSVRIVGGNVNIVLYVCRDIGGKIAKVPAVELIRPLDSCMELTLRELLFKQLAGQDKAGEELH